MNSAVKKTMMSSCLVPSILICTSSQLPSHRGGPGRLGHTIINENRELRRTPFYLFLGSLFFIFYVVLPPPNSRRQRKKREGERAMLWVSEFGAPVIKRNPWAACCSSWTRWGDREKERESWKRSERKKERERGKEKERNRKREGERERHWGLSGIIFDLWHIYV